MALGRVLDPRPRPHGLLSPAPPPSISDPPDLGWQRESQGDGGGSRCRRRPASSRAQAASVVKLSQAVAGDLMLTPAAELGLRRPWRRLDSPAPASHTAWSSSSTRSKLRIERAHRGPSLPLSSRFDPCPTLFALYSGMVQRGGGELEQRLDLVAATGASEAAGERGRSTTGSIRQQGGPARLPVRAAARPGACGKAARGGCASGPARAALVGSWSAGVEVAGSQRGGEKSERASQTVQTIE
ncbi:unnamed protein product [Urochloa humidicola]